MLDFDSTDGDFTTFIRQMKLLLMKFQAYSEF